MDLNGNNNRYVKICIANMSAARAIIGFIITNNCVLVNGAKLILNKKEAKLMDRLPALHLSEAVANCTSALGA